MFTSILMAKETQTCFHLHQAHHTHKGILNSSGGDEMNCQQDPTNIGDRFAVSVIKLLYAIIMKLLKCFYNMVIPKCVK